MLRLTLILLFCFCCGFLVNCDNDSYSSHISAVLKYLNSNPNRVYEYKTGVVVNAQQKADIVELTIYIDVTCTSSTQFLGVPCSEQQQECTAFVQNVNENDYKVLSDVSCKPKVDASTESSDEPSTALPYSQQDPKIDLSHEAVSSEKNVDFVAVKVNAVPCLGCPFDLNPNVKGVSELVDSALRHVETERDRRQALIKVIRLQQQVVAGVKYILLVEIAPTACHKDTSPTSSGCPIDEPAGTTFCEVIFLQRPWVSKSKSIIRNNCTVVQEYTASSEKGYEENDGNGNKNSYNNINKNVENNNLEVSSAGLSDIESQILPIDDTDNKPVIKIDHEDNVESITASIQESAKSPNPTDIYVESTASPTQPVQISPQTDTTESVNENQTDESLHADQTVLKTQGNPDNLSDENNIINNCNGIEVVLNKVKRSLRNKRDHSRRRRETLVGRPMMVPLNDTKILHLIGDALTKLDSVSDDANRNKVVDVISATSQIVAGVSYRIKVRITLSSCLKDDSTPLEDCEFLQDAKVRLCDIVVWDRPWLKTQTTVKCDDSDREFSFEDFPENKNEGLIKQHTERDVVGTSKGYEMVPENLKVHLKYLSNKSGYALRDVLSVDKQMVPGDIWKIKARVSFSYCKEEEKYYLDKLFGNSQMERSKVCNFKIWDPYGHPLGKEMNIVCICEGGDVFYFRAEQDVGHEEGTVAEIEKKPTIDSESVEKLTNILNNLDVECKHYNAKLKIDEILSVKRQTITGRLWNIKADVTLPKRSNKDSTNPNKEKPLEDTCTFKIWDNPWLVDAREIKVTCQNDPKPRNLMRYKRNVGASINDSGNEVDAKILKLVGAAVYKTNHTVSKVIKSSKQKVGGPLWQITVLVSRCLKYKANTLECEYLEEGNSKLCQIKIWGHPWLAHQLKVGIICEGDKSSYSFISTALESINIFDSEVVSTFKDFMLKHNKTYPDEVEFHYRLKVFKDNLNTIKLLNKYEQGSATYGITPFSDLTSVEFSKSHGLRSDLVKENYLPFMNAVIPDVELPTEFDWRKKGAVTEVKNQGSCGSCWAFSTTGNVEGQYAIKYGKLLEFSEQELVDCDKLDEGCNGGLMDNAYRFIEEMGGLESESDYPYEGDDEKCHFNKTKVRVEVTGALNISHNETDMAKWLVQNGPIAIGINANAMQFYVGGVSHPWRILCNPNSLDHGVLIVGFGVHKYPLFNKTLPYWTIKNSWGPSWGEQGYYRVYRGDGTCGLNQTPSSSIVA